MLTERHSASCRPGFLPGLALFFLHPRNGSGPKDHAWKSTHWIRFAAPDSTVLPCAAFGATQSLLWTHSCIPFCYLRLAPPAVPGHTLFYPPLLRLSRIPLLHRSLSALHIPWSRPFQCPALQLLSWATSHFCPSTYACFPDPLWST